MEDTNINFQEYMALSREERINLVTKLNSYYGEVVEKFFQENPEVTHILITGKEEIVEIKRKNDDPFTLLDPVEISKKLGKLVMPFARR